MTAVEWDGSNNWKEVASMRAEGSREYESVGLKRVWGNTHELTHRVVTEGIDALIYALMGSGKSQNAVYAALTTGEAITVLTSRKDLYRDYEDRCDELGLISKVLPAFFRDCPSASGEHGKKIQKIMKILYKSGVPSAEIHNRAFEILGRELPCKEHGRCPYQQEMLSFDPTEYDVLIGHYTHGNMAKVCENRTIFVDEFPGSAFITELGSDILPSVVGNWVHERPGMPFEDMTDLMENRRDRYREAMDWFNQNGLQPDYDGAIERETGHADASYATYALLNGSKLGNGWEHSELPDGKTAAYDRSEGSLYILSPPAFEGANAVVALDGTPTPELWELALSRSLDVRELMNEQERCEYIRDTLGLQLYQTTEHRYPNSSGNNHHPKADRPLFKSVYYAHETRPALIAPYNVVGGEERENAERPTYDSVGALEYIGTHDHSEAVRGSNDFTPESVGIVSQSNHFGDDYIQKWAALAGESAPTPDDRQNPDYGEFGNRIAENMIQHATLQQVMRFGRDGTGAVVYLHTSMIPEWVPLAGKGEAVHSWSKGMRKVLETIDDLEKVRFTSTDVAERTDLGKRQIENLLNKLENRGALNKRWDSGRNVFEDSGVGNMDSVGYADLGAVWEEPPELPDRESVVENVETARPRIYSVAGSDEGIPTTGW